MSCAGNRLSPGMSWDGDKWSLGMSCNGDGWSLSMSCDGDGWSLGINCGGGRWRLGSSSSSQKVLSPVAWGRVENQPAMYLPDIETEILHSEISVISNSFWRERETKRVHPATC